MHPAERAIGSADPQPDTDYAVVGKDAELNVFWYRIVLGGAAMRYFFLFGGLQNGKQNQ